MTRSTNHADRMARARLSLEGLSLGDAFGERFFVSPDALGFLLDNRALPGGRGSTPTTP